MKPHRDASELAARLSEAANKAVPLPAAPTVIDLVPARMRETPQRAQSKKAKTAKTGTDTVPITLRPSRATLNRYTLAAADRTRQIGRVISAQEMMLEKLEDAS